MTETLFSSKPAAVNIHEFQSKAIFRAEGIPVPEGCVAESAEDAGRAFSDLGGELAVVKAQIHAGGRGKGGGVVLVRSAGEAQEVASQMLGHPLVTPQTGPEGQVVKRVLVEAGTSIAHEYYAGITVDRQQGRPVLMVSTEGGMDIEAVAAESPEKILKEALHPDTGLQAWQARRLVYALGIPPEARSSAAQILETLGSLFLQKDCSLLEVNPLVLTASGEVVALDAKMNFDPNGLYRQPDIHALRDEDEEDPKEAEAAEAGLSYIALDGSIGCLVNGAGLAMGTMDTIKLAGSEPANFLDVGGGATAEQVATAFKIICSDSNVRAVLVNIFGGIMKCDVIAEGIVGAVQDVGVSVPLVVRLEGTNVEQGREILAASGIDLVAVSDLGEAAIKAVELAGGDR